MNYICKGVGAFCALSQADLLKNTEKLILEGYNPETRKGTGGGPLFILHVALPIFLPISTLSYCMNSQLTDIKPSLCIHFSKSSYDVTVTLV